MSDLKASMPKDIAMNEISKPYTQSILELPKWKLALIGAVPVAAIGLGFWYFKSSSKTNKSVAKKSTDGKLKTNDPPQPQTPFEHAQAAKNKGNKYFKGTKYEEAIKCYTQAIELCPEKHKQELSTFYQNRAAAQDQLKNYTAVIEDCTQALEYNNKYVKAMLRRAKACEMTEEYMQCLEDVTALCILENFGNYQSLTMADRVLKTMGKKKANEAYKTRVPVTPSKHFIRTYFSAFRNDPIMALVKARDESLIEKLTEENVEEHSDEKHQEEVSEKDQIIEQEQAAKHSPFMDALECIRTQDYGKVLQLCSGEINLGDSPHLAEALLLRGTFYQVRGEVNQAIDDFDKLLALPEVDKSIVSNALIKRGSLRMQGELQAEAFTDFTRAIECDPENSDIFHHRGQLNLLIEKIDDAVKDFERSVELSPSFPISHVQQCYTVYRQAFQQQSSLMLQDALKKFEAAIDQYPNCAEGMALYAQALSDQQKFDDADKYFNKALKIEPENGNLYVHRGLLQLQWKSDIDGAVELIKKALEIDNKCEFAFETLGTIEVQRGNLKEAVDLFNNAISLARTEMELSHLYSLQDAAIAQSRVATKFGISVPTAGMGQM